jgi:hypothetical protein
VKTDLTTSGSFAQSKTLLSRDALVTKDVGQKGLSGKLAAGSGPDYKVELSTLSKPASSSSVSTPEVSLPPLPDGPSFPDASIIGEDFPKDLAKDKIKNEVNKKLQETSSEEVRPGSLKKPAIIFIKGLDVFSSPSKSEGGYAGVGRLAEAVDGSRIYGWNQKEEIIKEISKVHPDYPVILVGHSLGGDTAIEIADELDSLQENFRRIDLLVTLDAIGFSHDIIPQNVKKHLNIFGEKSFLLSDGPHVARREDKTDIRNILSPHDHTDIDDDREIQYEIVELIKQSLSRKV